MFSPDPQNMGPQYLENLATGYWFSETLFTAVEMEIFSYLEPKGGTAEELALALNADSGGMERFLQALCALGLLTGDGCHYYNTQVSSKYLVSGKDYYQGDSILWRKYLATGWGTLAQCLQAGGRVNYGPPDEESGELARRIKSYINAMDRVARTKVEELIPFFDGLVMTGDILDVGAGSGAVAAGFLERFPEMRATLVDLPEVLGYAREIMKDRGLEEKISFSPANILEVWPVIREGFDLIIISNIVHAYAEQEISTILQKASDALKPGGVMLIHDFFREHCSPKAAVFDLNMFINTYNGKVFSQKWVREHLSSLKLYSTELIPLETDTAVIFAAKSENNLANLSLNSQTRLIARLKEMGFRQVDQLSVDRIQVRDWVDLKCRYGCSKYGKRQCPPHGPDHEKTRRVLKNYKHALLLEGEPPTGAFQLQVLEAEKEAFKAGFYKALAYWAGPCSICSACSSDGNCHNPGRARPSMEGAGIDVFETVRGMGITLQPLKSKEEYVKYYALLLLE